MKKFLLSFLWVLIMVGSHAYAQTRTVTGTVIGKDDGLPLPGVSVIVRGTKVGTQTGSDGTYSIKVPEGSRSLVFSFVGFTTQTVNITSNRVNVTLSGSASELNEVVVLGYGSQVKRDNIGSVSNVKGKDVAEQPVQNFQQSLGGRAAGVQVTIPAGVVNSQPTIRIRGINSISLSSQPLFIIDGVAAFSDNTNGSSATSSPLSALNPDDIESISIAKDASETAIYGSRAANGVVFVTTKKGKKGKSVVSMDNWIGFSKVQRLPDLLNAQQYVDMKNEALVNAGTFNNDPTTPSKNVYFALSKDANGNPIDVNWFDYVYRTGKAYNSSISISGANDNTSYYLSANYSKQGGILVKNDYIRKGIDANVDHHVGKLITVGAKISYANESNLSAVTSGSQNGEAFNIAGLGRIPLVSPPNVSPYNNDGTYNLSGNTLGLGANKGISTSYYNIVPLLDLNRSNSYVNHIVSNIYFQLKPLSWITLKTVYGIDNFLVDNDIFQSPVHGDGAPTGSATATYAKNMRWVWDNTAQFDYTFLTKHNFSLLAGNEQQRDISRGFGVNRTVISDPSFNVIQAGYGTTVTSGLTYGDNYLVSFFGRLNYDFDKKYFLSGTLRQDQDSRFGPDRKKGVFASAAAGWEITREKFWNAIGADKIFSSFKLRGSYGKVGNNLGLGNYASYGLYANSLYNGAATLYYNQTGNNMLGWETSKKTDFGFNFGVLNDRISGEVAYYKNNISGLIFQVREAPSAGLPTDPYVNIGTMYNKGLEVTLNADAFRTKDFAWTTSFNISFNQNKLTSIVPGITRLTSQTSSNEVTSINEVGHSIGSLYIVRTAGVDPATGRRIFINGQGQKVYYNYAGGNLAWTYADGTKAPAITQAADAVNYVNTSPKEVGGFNNTFRYKNFDLNVLLTFQLGYSIYWGTHAGLLDQRFWNNSTEVLNRWTTPGQVTNIPKVIYGDNVSNGSSIPLDVNVYNGNFLKVKTVNFGYSLPKSLLSKVGISNLRFYVSGYNLFIITKYPGPDPEVSSNGPGNTSTGFTANSTQGVDRNSAANSRTITAGFSVKF